MKSLSLYSLIILLFIGFNNLFAQSSFNSIIQDSIHFDADLLAEHELLSKVAAYATPNGELIFEDGEQMFFYLYNPKSNSFTQYGGLGEGPGEFKAIGTVSVIENKIVAEDYNLMRLTIYDRTNNDKYVTQMLPKVNKEGGFRFLSMMENGNYLFYQEMINADQPISTRTLTVTDTEMEPIKKLADFDFPLIMFKQGGRQMTIGFVVNYMQVNGNQAAISYETDYKWYFYPTFDTQEPIVFEKEFNYTVDEENIATLKKMNFSNIPEKVQAISDFCLGKEYALTLTSVDADGNRYLDVWNLGDTKTTKVYKSMMLPSFMNEAYSLSLTASSDNPNTFYLTGIFKDKDGFYTSTMYSLSIK